ncbi:MAG: hypothetical protein ACRC78_03145 [Planktothrix sp.]
MNYFSDDLNLATLRQEYKRLAFLHHPDRGGNSEIMKTINCEYTQSLREALRERININSCEESPEAIIHLIDILEYTGKADTEELTLTTGEVVTVGIETREAEAFFIVHFRSHNDAVYMHCWVSKQEFAEIKSKKYRTKCQQYWDIDLTIGYLWQLRRRPTTTIVVDKDVYKKSKKLKKNAPSLPKGLALIN